MFHRIASPALFDARVCVESAVFDIQLADEATSGERAQVRAELPTAHAARRAEFVAGRRCAVAASLRAGPLLPPFSIAMGPERDPVWPPGLIGSIAHTDGIAIAAVTSAPDLVALGVDVEERSAGDALLGVEARVASPRELAVIDASLGLARTDARSLLFSAKESVFKCLYPRLGRYVGFLEVELTEARASSCTFRPRGPLATALPRGTALEVRFALDEHHLYTGVALPSATSMSPR